MPVGVWSSQATASVPRLHFGASGNDLNLEPDICWADSAADAHSCLSVVCQGGWIFDAVMLSNASRFVCVV
jgi:hypothetical protein